MATENDIIRVKRVKNLEKLIDQAVQKRYNIY